MKTIDLEEEQTWPADITLLLEQNLESLRNFEEERARIDKLCRECTHLRMSPPLNPHDKQRETVLNQINGLLSRFALTGYHCTRLAEDEIAQIHKSGLLPLSKKLLVERIHRRCTAGDLSPEIAERLISTNQASEDWRSGQLWFVFSKSQLADEFGISRFFKSWGGEALYNSHEQDEETGPLLRSIGMPCIIEVAVPVKKIYSYSTVGEHFYRIFLHRHNVGTSHESEMEGRVGVAVLPEQIRRLLRISDVDFTKLTKLDSWQDVSFGHGR